MTASLCVYMGCRADFSVCLWDVKETCMCVYEGCGADYGSNNSQLNYLFETPPPPTSVSAKTKHY